jgi:FkbM family methyltransferase
MADSSADDGGMGEVLQRLIHIEQKINRVMADGTGRAEPDRSLGHPDQAFGPLSYAQHGEDLIFLNIFYFLGIERPSYLDIGAFHPLNISNTALLYRRGSRGINVEANPNLIEEFHRHRPEDVNLNIGVSVAPGKLTYYCIDKWSGRNTFDRKVAEAFVSSNPQFRIQETIEIETVTINDIVATHSGGKWPNLLSIDAEGLDYAILESADFRGAGPEVLCIEAISGSNSDDSDKIVRLLHERSYRPVFRTIGNVIFVRNDVAPKVLAGGTR